MKNGAMNAYFGEVLPIKANACSKNRHLTQVEPMLDELAKLENGFGKPDTLLADSGYFQSRQRKACGDCGMQPLIAPTPST
ncbi:MAG: hypothetical protein KGZ80_01815 [Methylomonas sp.]|nr:hypothetical protein [Methylomonas sp.]PPD19557.1 MAG: hypothetical protein CTY23_11430 [Methylomonas sp.]PPD25072.1 MAG: hypothetical protein CTY22_09780 [Methylomonas sp.]PPD34428.1 MAG: hypothetical protein CTY21_09810 [Methylomonas sp.]PPD38751.1 MAG: hypothetical protein CTY17_08990 [Methylomonas sp.]